MSLSASASARETGRCRPLFQSDSKRSRTPLAAQESLVEARPAEQGRHLRYRLRREATSLGELNRRATSMTRSCATRVQIHVRCGCWTRGGRSGVGCSVGCTRAARASPPAPRVARPCGPLGAPAARQHQPPPPALQHTAPLGWPAAPRLPSSPPAPRAPG